MDEELFVAEHSEALMNAAQRLLDFLNNLSNKTYDETCGDMRKHIESARLLGKYGWTVNGSITPDNLGEWLHIIESRGEAEIAELFSETVIEEIIDRMTNRYEDKVARIYLERALDNYHTGHYTESALFFLALLNRSINEITPAEVKRLTQKCKTEIDAIGKNKYQRLKNVPEVRLFLVGDYLPSFSAYAIRTFVDGDEHNMDTGTEPTYLNRNWLMHGKMSRLVKRYECIQLINAFNTLMEIEEILSLEERTNNEQDSNQELCGMGETETHF